MCLGPRLLEYDDPELVAVRGREARSTKTTWYKVIYDYFLEDAILVHLDREDALIIHLLKREEPLNAFGALGQHRQDRQEVAVAELALNDVLRRDRVGKDGQLTLIVVQLGNVSCTDPLDRAPGFHLLLNLFGVILPVVNERLGLRREAFINKLDALVLALFERVIVAAWDGRCFQDLGKDVSAELSDINIA